MYCRGRFDVFEDDNILESPGWHGSPKHEQRRGEERDQTRKERDESESRRGGSGPLVPEKVVSGVRGRDEDHDRSLLSNLLMFREPFCIWCMPCYLFLI